MNTHCNCFPISVLQQKVISALKLQIQGKRYGWHKYSQFLFKLRTLSWSFVIFRLESYLTTAT